jgi:hypothetical protein
MTAFNNIKTNNWPAASNDLEDFLVLELPLNDQAALTTSRAIVAGSKILYPKRTLTNTGVSSLSTQGRLWSSTLDTTNTNDLPFRANDIQAAFGPTSAQVETATNGVGRIIWLDFAGNGGAITGSTLKVLGAGVSTSLRDVYLNNASTKSGQLDDLINITGTIINSIQIKSNASNAGAVLAGIELDGVRLVDPLGGLKKHYDENAVFDGTRQLTIPASPAFNLAGDFTYEAWTKQDASVSNGTLMSSAGYYSGSNAGNWLLRRSSATQIAFATYDGTSNAEYNELSASTSLNTWHHIALVRSGTTVQIFVDGVAGGSMTVSKGLEDGANNGLVIGNAGSNNPWNGNFQDVRLYNGVAKYTANFTPPGAILG